MGRTTYRFCNRPEYFRQLAREIHQTPAGGRIAVAAMAFDSDEPLVAAVMHELSLAAKRGARVYLAIDAYSFLIAEKPLRLGPLWYGTPISKSTKEPFARRYAALEALRASGGTYGITNRPTSRFTIPQAGRSHIKTAIVNNTVYVGGHNLTAPEEVDIMTLWVDATAADYLYNFVQSMIREESPRAVLQNHDTVRRLSSGALLILDAGIPRNSRILDEALQLIDEAESWIYMACPYFPGGKVGQHLLAAQTRGVNVQLVYNHPRAHGREAIGHYIHNARERLRLPAAFFTNQIPKQHSKLHAKFIATEQGAILGSHNYVSQGVQLGTAELAVLIKDPAFAQAGVAAITKELLALQASSDH